jgi:AraC-like DNA-binding protein
MTANSILITAVFFAFLVAGAISMFLTYRQTNKVLKNNYQLVDEVENQKELQHQLHNELKELKEQLKPQDRISELHQETESLRENINETKDMSDDELREWIDLQMTESHMYADPDLNLKGIAQRLGLTQKKIKQLLKDDERYDRLYDYLTEKRVLYSCELIKENPQWSMDAISKEAGFVSRTTFQTEFKKRIGVTPAQYRQHTQNEVVRAESN